MAEYSKVGDIITTVHASDAVKILIALKREGFVCRLKCIRKVFHILITDKVS